MPSNKILTFSDKLLTWYEENKRDLPWRNTNDPYKIWLSETILQQTRVVQGLPYYEKFINSFPTIFDLAHAEEKSVYHLWQGLGYYSRAKNLQTCAKEIVQSYRGSFPNQYEKLIKLKGIGPYTASAILSFAFHKKIALVDGNVYRILARFFAIYEAIPSQKSLKTFAQIATTLLPNTNHQLFNQAIMDFGATVCKPKKPMCDHCVFSTDCIAFQEDKIATFPIKIAKRKPTERFISYLIFFNQFQLVIHKRSSKDIWKNLYDFPHVEVDSMEQHDVKKMIQTIWKKYKLKPIDILENQKHILSHQHLINRFIFINHIPQEVLEEEGNLTISFSELSAYPFPTLIKKVFDIHEFQNKIM